MNSSKNKKSGSSSSSAQAFAPTSAPAAASGARKEPRTAARGSRRSKNAAVFAMLAALMFASKIVMEGLPNIHILGMLTMVLTLTYRVRALIPIYLYAVLLGLFYGFDPLWWPLHLYVWTVLWGMTMLLPKNMPKWAGAVVYPGVCAMHGLIYGTLCAPYSLLIMTGDITWPRFTAYIASGFSFDLLHAAGNAVFGLFILPLTKLLRRIDPL